MILKTFTTLGILLSLNSYALDLNGTWRGTTNGNLESSQGWQKNCMPFDFEIQQNESELLFRSAQMECGSTVVNMQQKKFVIQGEKLFEDRQKSGLVEIGTMNQNGIRINLKSSIPFAFNFSLKKDGTLEFKAIASFENENLTWSNELTLVH